ncbi:hypothetical protein ACFQFC_26150 [Amorphoplanes digitatis]|uniref:Uncharacterized protein n=1 Tax=Actinoplanes digitatis TaxID=1868 RepID=A0A7W7MM36_9ACTN|nr:hypothetical protein [Actinoplanes digitatis]MBB4759621.1 hypothetical protein [Actinoplanes digitatis]BFE67519.1 hypothetical protein GCM10020092_008200 [Actinoplanes digitatis]
MTLGLPFAVTVGWTLGTPAPSEPVLSAPGGAGGIGHAPERVAKPASESNVAWSPPATTPVAVASSLAVADRAAIVAPSAAAAPSTVVSGAPSPAFTLLQPPVPTPTMVIAPPSPSATAPSASADPEVSGLGEPQLAQGS